MRKQLNCLNSLFTLQLLIVSLFNVDQMQLIYQLNQKVDLRYQCFQNIRIKNTLLIGGNFV
ncbi:unnamed protein product [Paramecium pentaurelia]|uniref:Uncharacterized protein n=1 Tax=Paramecium pentaurelia TaxID=43138 RepID=A0A8S1UMV5_9CILI|nr:unnamed protein product [Paramecium pentaurelia]